MDCQIIYFHILSQNINHIFIAYSYVMYVPSQYNDTGYLHVMISSIYCTVHPYDKLNVNVILTVNDSADSEGTRTLWVTLAR